MKKLRNAMIALALCSSLVMQTGCYGSFKLTNSLYDWNGDVGDKWVRSLVFFALCIVPVYEGAVIIDAVILNLIEFWSGKNPVSMKEGESEEQIVMKDGEVYRITATKDRFDIVALTGAGKGQETSLVFTEKNMTWNVEKDGQLVAISRLEKGAGDMPYVRIFDRSGASKLIAAPADEASMANVMGNLHQASVAIK